MEKDIEALLEEAEHHARDFYARNPRGCLSPIFLALTDVGRTIAMHVPFRSDREKDFAIATVRARLRQIGAVACCVASESWIAMGEGCEDHRPSEHPRREERVVISLVHRGGTVIRFFKLARDWKGAVVALERDSEMEREGMEVSGRFVELIDFGTLH